MFGPFKKKQELIDNLRSQLMQTEESLRISRECHDKATREVFALQKRIDYLQKELLLRSQENDSLRGKLPTQKHWTQRVCPVEWRDLGHRIRRLRFGRG